MVNLASLLGVLASATGLMVLVALGRIAFGRHLASLHHLGSLGIHRTRRRGGGGSGSGARSTGSLPLAHCCCVRSIFLPPQCKWFLLFQSLWVFFRLSLSLSLSSLLSLYCHLPLARSPIGSVCLGKGYANVQIADHRTGKSSQLSGSPQTLPDGATSMPEAKLCSKPFAPRRSSKAVSPRLSFRPRKTGLREMSCEGQTSRPSLAVAGYRLSCRLERRKQGRARALPGRNGMQRQSLAGKARIELSTRAKTHQQEAQVLL
ncbi:hypothetical protein GGI42DRAFT_100829 [Trichoderma sp. SZMC 28013]